MSERREQCQHCGYFFPPGNPFFSEAHAAYFSQDPVFCLIWCYNCSHINHYEQTRLIGLIKLPAVKYKSSFLINSHPNHPVCKTRNRELGLFAAVHLLRMIWHTLGARAKLEHGGEDYKRNAMMLAFQKLCPRDIALMCVMTANAERQVPLEQQIHEGMYLGRDEAETVSTMKDYVMAAGDGESRQNVLNGINEMSAG